VASPLRSKRVTGSIDDITAQRTGGIAVERPRDETHYVVPVALRGAQHVFVSRGRFEPPQAKRVVLIKWVIKGECMIGVGGRRISFGPRQAAVYLPTLPHQFWAVADSSELLWFSIDGPLAEQFMRELELRPGVYPYGAAPVEQVHELMESLKDPSIQGRRRASMLAIRAIYDLANATRATKTPTAVEQVQYLIHQEFADPNLSSETLAAKVCYHRGSLSRMFHQHTGVTIIDYLTQVRLQEARTLLKHTEDKVADISRMCGFREPTYFCRWLRKHTGFRPSDLRHHNEI
jgi:AraC-like DNA-binding protein